MLPRAEFIPLRGILEERSKRVSVIVGARSAVFAPFKSLGLIVIDEEHETSYKQSDPAPRYHAREVARARAQLTGATVLLGSATPSIESYYAAAKGAGEVASA